MAMGISSHHFYANRIQVEFRNPKARHDTEKLPHLWSRNKTGGEYSENAAETGPEKFFFANKA